MVHLPDLCNILNGLIKMSTDCLIDLIFIILAAQLYYLKIVIWETIFIRILTNGWNSQNII